MIITGPGVEVNKTNSNLPVYGMRCTNGKISYIVVYGTSQ